MTDKITWEEGRYSTHTGYIHGEAKKYKAKIEIFTIHYSSSRDDIKAGTPYLLRHRLPLREIDRKFASRQQAEEHAERYLLWAFDLMGFVPKESE